MIICLRSYSKTCSNTSLLLLLSFGNGSFQCNTTATSLTKELDVSLAAFVSLIFVEKKDILCLLMLLLTLLVDVLLCIVVG